MPLVGVPAAPYCSGEETEPLGLGVTTAGDNACGLVMLPDANWDAGSRYKLGVVLTFKIVKRILLCCSTKLVQARKLSENSGWTPSHLQTTVTYRQVRPGPQARLLQARVSTGSGSFP